jgi:hypothetical protein
MAIEEPFAPETWTPTTAARSELRPGGESGPEAKPQAPDVARAGCGVAVLGPPPVAKRS